MKKRIFVCILALLMAFSCFTACGPKDPAPKPTQTPLPTVNVTPEPSQQPDVTPKPTPGAQFVNPLTGLATEKDISNNRPYAVMINNLYDALPQCGVSQADIIYEVMAEGGITRMLAVFQDVTKAGTIGSVRSTRSYYLDIAQSMDAILLHCGASVQGYEDISNRGYDTMDGMYMGSVVSLYYRDPNRMAAGYEHSLFTSSDMLASRIPIYTSLRLNHKDGFVNNLYFGTSSAANGSAASHIEVEYSYYKDTVFTYDATTGLYRIEQFDEPYVDGNTNEQVAVKNVLVLKALHSNVPEDPLNTIEVDLQQGGVGYYFCEGKCVEINWTKGNYAQQFNYTLKDGTPVTFAPGTSYVNIIETGNAVNIA